jgi:flagellar protein FliS
MKKDGRFLEEVTVTICRLRDAYAVVSQQDNSGPVMKNAQTLYAGLTYGRKALNEASIGFNDSKRGFMA